MLTFCFAQERIILKDLNKKKHGHSRLVNWMVKMEIVEKLLAILCPFCCWESHLFQHESFLIMCCSDPVCGEVLQPQHSLYLYRILTSEEICQSFTCVMLNILDGTPVFTQSIVFLRSSVGADLARGMYR